MFRIVSVVNGNSFPILGPRFIQTNVSPSHVLVPLDGSPLAEEALSHALETFDCRITVLNVVTEIATGTSEGPIIEAGDDRIAEATDRATELVEDARADDTAVDRPIETVVETGDPAETILAYVEDHDVDHVVMGSHGGDGGELRRRLLGTVSTAVIAEAPIPVTVVR